MEKLKYKIISNPNDEKDDHWYIRLEEPKWSGILYKYNEIAFGDEPENGKMKLKFAYDIVEVPPSIKESVMSDEESIEFETLLGDILVKIIEDDLERREEEDKDGSRRISYSKKSDSKRVIHTKSNSFPKD